MGRTRAAGIAIVASAFVVVAVLLARSTIFAHSSSPTGLCDRELRPGQPASKSLIAEATNQARALALAPIGTPPPEVITTTNQSKAIAQARLAGGDGVIATVGVQSITRGDLLAQEETVQFLQGQDEETLTAQALPPEIFKQFTERRKLIQQAGIPNVALAKLISDAAIYQYALDQGCQPTPREVSAKVARDKTLTHQGKEPPLAVSASVYGPKFWTVIYPESVRRLLATNHLRASLTASLIPPPLSAAEATPPADAWNDLSWRVVSRAHVSVKNSSVIAPATVSGALDYLKRYHAAGFGP